MAESTSRSDLGTGILAPASSIHGVEIHTRRQENADERRRRRREQEEAESGSEMVDVPSHKLDRLA